MREGVSVQTAVLTYWLCLLALVAVLWAYEGPVIGSNDVRVYERIGIMVSNVSSGGELPSEYPPPASLVFFGVEELAKLMAMPFVVTWPWALIAIFALAGVVMWLLGEALDVMLVSLAFTGAVLLLGGDLGLARYDVLVGLALLVGWRLLVRGRYATAGVALVLAVGLKMVPIVLLPLALMLAGAGWWKLGRGMMVGLVLLVGVSLIILGPATLGKTIQFMLTYHGERGIQVESSWSGVQILLTRLQGGVAEIGNHHGAAHNMELGATTSGLAAISGVLGIGVFYWLVWRRRFDVGDFAALGAVLLFFLLLVAPVLSPQFFAWPLMLAIGWLVELSLRSGLRWREVLLVLALAVMGLLSQWPTLPGNYGELMDQEWLSVWVLVARNGLIVAVLVGMWVLVGGRGSLGEDGRRR